MGTSSTDLALTVAWVDHLEGVASGKGIARNPKPGAAENDKEEKADDICTATTPVGTFVRWIVVLVFVRTHLIFTTAAAHPVLKYLRTQLNFSLSTFLVRVEYCDQYCGNIQGNY